MLGKRTESIYFLRGGASGRTWICRYRCLNDSIEQFPGLGSIFAYGWDVQSGWLIGKVDASWSLVEIESGQTRFHLASNIVEASISPDLRFIATMIKDENNLQIQHRVQIIDFKKSDTVDQPFNNGISWLDGGGMCWTADGKYLVVACAKDTAKDEYQTTGRRKNMAQLQWWRVGDGDRGVLAQGASPSPLAGSEVAFRDGEIWYRHDPTSGNCQQIFMQKNLPRYGRIWGFTLGGQMALVSYPYESYGAFLSSRAVLAFVPLNDVRKECAVIIDAEGYPAKLRIDVPVQRSSEGDSGEKSEAGEDDEKAGK